MKKFVTSAAFILLVATMSLTSTVESAYACEGVSCDQPTGVGKGNKAPVWKVLRCVVGPADNRKTVNCKSEEAEHFLPTGIYGVCFIGSDGKEHYDYQWVVHKGRKFKNRKINGRWQPDWQS
jgi:hypothetical protein